MSFSSGIYETHEEMEENLSWELAQSKWLLEQNLPGKSASHFCYPWFQGSSTTDRLARRAGYSAVHYGISIPRVRAEDADAALPLRIPRVSEEYLCRLPGPGRDSLAKVARRRVEASLGRRAGRRE